MCKVITLLSFRIMLEEEHILVDVGESTKDNLGDKPVDVKRIQNTNLASGIEGFSISTNILTAD